MTSFFACWTTAACRCAVAKPGRWASWSLPLALIVGVLLESQAGMAQPGAVMQIPVPAPVRGASVGGPGGNNVSSGSSQVTQPGTVSMPGEILLGEPLAMPGETVPVGSWSGRAGVKAVAVAEMPWMAGGVGTSAVAFAPPGRAPVPAQVPAQYRVVVATPSEGHVQALKQVVPEAIALEGGRLMQAGAFVDWRRANALRRAVGAYGFQAEVRGLSR